MTKYCSLSFFKIDPKWRWMSDLAKDESSKEVQNVINNANTNYKTYSTLGLQSNSEFLLCMMTNSLEEIQTTISKLYFTVFGKYIIPTDIYTSIISNSSIQSQSTTNLKEQKKYMAICIIIKKSRWNDLDEGKKQSCIQTCFNIIKKNKVICKYSKSINSCQADAILTLESDNIINLQDIMNKLNHIISEYANINSMICIQKNIQKLIISLG